MPQKMCRDEHRASAFAKQTIARQGDLPAFQQYGTLDLPAANCIRSECRTSDARPYAASRKGCRDAHCASAVLRHLPMNPVGTRIARPRLRSKQSPGRAISLRFSNPVRWICLRQIAFVPNAGRAMLVPTRETETRRLPRGAHCAPTRADARRRDGALDLPAANCIRSECRTSNARPCAVFQLHLTKRICYHRAAAETADYIEMRETLWQQTKPYRICS